MEQHLWRILIALGVLAWAPYGVAKYAMEADVSVAPFLAAHLLGVVPGALLRRRARFAARGSGKELAWKEHRQW